MSSQPFSLFLLNAVLKRLLPQAWLSVFITTKTLCYTVKNTGIWASTKGKLILPCLCKTGISSIYIKQLKYLKVNKALPVTETLSRILNVWSLSVILSRISFQPFRAMMGTELLNFTRLVFSLTEDINMRALHDFVFNYSSKGQSSKLRIEWWRWFSGQGLAQTGSGWPPDSQGWDSRHFSACLPECEWCLCGVKSLKSQQCLTTLVSLFSLLVLSTEKGKYSL